MPKAGDSYTIELKTSHLNWGQHRYTATRDPIAGEGYIPIPKARATEFDIKLGNLYQAVFSDGFSSFTCRASGNSHAGDVYAKQFQGDGDLKAFGRWFTYCQAKEGDTVQVRFISDSIVQFELIR